MTTSAALCNLLRGELSDLGRSFIWTTIADGSTDRFDIPHAPIDGPSLVVTVAGLDVSNACEVEERTGVLTLDAVPEAGDQIIVAGKVYRFFTDTEIAGFVDTAFVQHSATSTDVYGRRYTLATLPPVEEYPVAVLAAKLALTTLATDAAFDIDIMAPDGVTIPRSERYRQLTEMAMMREAQYRDLCVNLGVGMYRIETQIVRRVSNRTNRLSPVYIPMEIDDRGTPVRVRIPIPNYGTVPLPSAITVLDLFLKAGDDFSQSINLGINLTGYDIDAQVRHADLGTLLAVFTINVTDVVAGVLTLSLTALETQGLPQRSAWEVQITHPTSGAHTPMKGQVFVERDLTNPSDPRASGWRATP